MQHWLESQLGPTAGVLAAAGLAAGVLVSFVAVSALFFIWLERKVAGRIQDRLGPTRVGGRFGWLQTLADGIKLLCKEDTRPAAADAFLFRAAPYLAFAGAFVPFFALPFGPGLVGYEVQAGVFFVLAVASTEVFGVVLAGYGSGSKWSLFGATREAAQVVSYEVPRGLCVLVAVLISGSLSLSAAAEAQAGPFWNWHAFRDPFALLALGVFFVCATAGCKRAPFDLAEAESELVAGFHTEYSGLRWSFFFMAEYATMFTVSALAVLLFLGGWHTGLLPFEPADQWGPLLGNLLNVPVFVFKCWALVFVMMWARWSLPRLRIDQVMTTCLQYLLPVSCALLAGECLWLLVVPAGVRAWVAVVVAWACVASAAGVAVNLWLRAGDVPAGRLTGVWRDTGTPLTRTEGVKR